MILRVDRILILILILFAGNLSGAQAADEDRYLPSSANAVGVIRVREILNSPRATREGWAEAQQERFLTGAATFPPSVEKIASAWNFRPAGPEAAWSVSLATWPQEVSIPAIVEKEGGTPQEIAGKPAVACKRGALFVKLEPQLLGVARFGSRQDAARWIRSAEQAAPAELSSYLGDVAKSPSHIALGLDTEDMFDPNRVAERLALSPSLKGRERRIPALADLIVNMRGIRLDIAVDDRTTAEVTLNFRSDLAGLDEYVKPLLLEALGDLGASIEDLERGRVKVAGTDVRISADLSDDGLRRVISLFALPHPAEVKSAGEQPRVSRTAVDRRASERYVQQVGGILDDLERMSQRGKDYGKTATWHDNFAKKIDNLPPTGVDPELLRWGASTSSKVRALAASLRGVAVDVDTQQQSVTYNQYYDPGYFAVNVWGGVGYREPTYRVESNLEQVREAQAAAVSRGAKEREAIWQMINDERAAASRRLDEVSRTKTP